MEQNQRTCMVLLRHIHDEIEKHGNQNLQRYGVTLSQMHMLITLHRAEETGSDAPKLKELERYFRVAQSTAAGIAVRLEKKGLVRSFTDPEDKRIKRLQITDRGREVCEGAHAGMQETQRRLFSGLTPEEEAEFTRLLQKVYDALK